MFEIELGKIVVVPSSLLSLKNIIIDNTCPAGGGAMAGLDVVADGQLFLRCAFKLR